MGNALYVENNAGDVELLDGAGKNVRKGTEHVKKEEAQLLYDQLLKDITRSVTADGYVRMRPKHGKKHYTYRVNDKQFKVDFSRVYSV